MKFPPHRTSKRKSLSGSMAVSSCPSPPPAIKEHLALVEENEEKDQESIVNPTPMVGAFNKLAQFDTWHRLTLVFIIFITDGRDDEQEKVGWNQNPSEVSG